MTELTLVVDEVDDEQVKVYGKHPKELFNHLICIVHVDMIKILFGQNIDKYWFVNSRACDPGDSLEIIVTADPKEEE